MSLFEQKNGTCRNRFWFRVGFANDAGEGGGPYPWGGWPGGTYMVGASGNPGNPEDPAASWASVSR